MARTRQIRPPINREESREEFISRLSPAGRRVFEELTEDIRQAIPLDDQSRRGLDFIAAQRGVNHDSENFMSERERRIIEEYNANDSDRYRIMMEEQETARIRDEEIHRRMEQTERIRSRFYNPRPNLIIEFPEGDAPSDIRAWPTGWWRMRNGRWVKLEDMSLKHLNNCLELMERMNFPVAVYEVIKQQLIEEINRREVQPEAQRKKRVIR